MERHRTILLVENSDDFTEIVRRTLGVDERLELCAVASTAEDALEVSEALQPDLVVLDHFLDSIHTGVEISPTLKKVSPRTKVILFTDYDLSFEARSEPAIDAFLDKKRLRDLVGLVGELLGLAPLQPAAAS